MAKDETSVLSVFLQALIDAAKEALAALGGKPGKAKKEDEEEDEEESEDDEEEDEEEDEDDEEEDEEEEDEEEEKPAKAKRLFPKPAAVDKAKVGELGEVAELFGKKFLAGFSKVTPPSKKKDIIKYIIGCHHPEDKIKGNIGIIKQSLKLLGVKNAAGVKKACSAALKAFESEE